MGKYTPAGQKRAAQVLAFPAMQAIPAPDLPLQGPAYDKYVELARRLLDAGKLNMQTKALCERIGVLHGEIHKRIEFGRQVSATSLDRLGKLLAELQFIDSSERAAPQSPKQENRFTRFGVVVRRGAQKAEIRSS